MKFLIPITTNAQTPLSGTAPNIRFNRLTAFGFKAFNATNGIPTNNDAPVYMGMESGRLPFVVSSGEYINIEMGGGAYESLANVWVKGTTNDGLYIWLYS